MKVYKYRFGSKRDLESLENDYFFAPHPKNLNDPFENLFSKQSFQKQFKILKTFFGHNVGQLELSIQSILNKIESDIGIYSLSLSPLDELLWAYYADSHRGFVIEYDLEKLIELNKRQIAAHFKVNYQENVPELDLTCLIQNRNSQEILSKLSGVKSTSWKHEKEYRIIVEHHGIVNYDFRAVTAIYFGLNASYKENNLFEKDINLPNSLDKVTMFEVMKKLQGRGIKYFQIGLKKKNMNSN